LAGTRLTGQAVSHVRAYHGRVIVVATEPVLTAERVPPGSVTLYGWPGKTYWIQWNTNLSEPTGWLNLLQVPLTTPFQRIEGLETNLPAIFYRAE
jgi:hypothetical protein